MDRLNGKRKKGARLGTDAVIIIFIIITVIIFYYDEWRLDFNHDSVGHWT